MSLSGGIDSSSIVAMLRRTTSGPIKTFSLGFDEPWDETDDARFVAQTFGTDHHELVLHEPALAHLADAIRHTEEPKVNSLQLYLLHRFIGEHVSVVLSGLGGDELFAGYDFYGYLLRSRRLRSGALGAAVARAWRPLLDWAARRSAGLGRPELDLADPQAGVAGLRPATGPGNYLLLRNAWDFNPSLLRRVYTPEFAEPARRVRRGTPTTPTSATATAAGEPGPAGRVRHQDGVRPAAQRGHHVHGALGRVPGPAARPRAGPVRRPHPGPTSGSAAAPRACSRTP